MGRGAGVAVRGLWGGDVCKEGELEIVAVLSAGCEEGRGEADGAWRNNNRAGLVRHGGYGKKACGPIPAINHII